MEPTTAVTTMTSISSMSTVLTDMLALGKTFIEWCCTTFPINVAIAGSVIGTVMYTVRNGKKVAR